MYICINIYVYQFCSYGWVTLTEQRMQQEKNYYNNIRTTLLFFFTFLLDWKKKKNLIDKQLIMIR